jgi:hypothetical protein
LGIGLEITVACRSCCRFLRLLSQDENFYKGVEPIRLQLIWDDISSPHFPLLIMQCNVGGWTVVNVECRVWTGLMFKSIASPFSKLHLHLYLPL